jgi:hypothetical protein
VPATEFATTLVVLDLAGIFVFAVSGALVAVRKNLDLFAALVLIGATPPAAPADWRYLLVPVAAGLMTFFFHTSVGRLERVVTIFDAFGLALFCVTGALRAVDYGLGPLPAALLGVLRHAERQGEAVPAVGGRHRDVVGPSRAELNREGDPPVAGVDHRRHSRSTSRPTSRGTAYSISRKRTRRGVTKTRWASCARSSRPQARGRRDARPPRLAP